LATWIEYTMFGQTADCLKQQSLEAHLLSLLSVRLKPLRLLLEAEYEFLQLLPTEPNFAWGEGSQGRGVQRVRRPSSHSPLRFSPCAVKYVPEPCCLPSFHCPS